LPIIDAIGIRGIKWAIGVLNTIPESGFKASKMKLSSSRIVRLTRYLCPQLFYHLGCSFKDKIYISLQVGLLAKELLLLNSADEVSKFFQATLKQLLVIF
jgi:hypothetical protein